MINFLWSSYFLIPYSTFCKSVQNCTISYRVNNTDFFKNNFCVRWRQWRLSGWLYGNFDHIFQRICQFYLHCQICWHLFAKRRTVIWLLLFKLVSLTCAILLWTYLSTSKAIKPSLVLLAIPTCLFYFRFYLCNSFFLLASEKG